jgi:hypothetical protein
MVDQTPPTQNNMAETPHTPTTRNAADTKAAAPEAQHATTKSDEPGRPAAQADKDPMKELLEHLHRSEPLIANIDRHLAQTIQILTQQGAEAERRAQPGFRHQVAYALQDLEKYPIWPVPITAELRSEMTRLAATAPGLENERMLALMRETAVLEDKRLITDIRRTGTDIGVRLDQNTPDIGSQIEVLENRVRLSQRRPEPATADQHSGHSRPAPTADGAGTSRCVDAAPDHPAQQRGAAAGQQPANARGPLDTILAGMRGRDQGPGAPWDPPHTPMAGRIAAFERQMQESAGERALQRAERSGRTAVNALEAFRTGEGATVMNRIREAARSEPGGMAAVLSEMRIAGRFADLRQQFNNALETERGVTAAYDKAAAALARYGQHRVGIEQVIARRPDAANLSAKFEQMDAQIGEAAANTPSRRDGKTMADDLAQKAAELLHRAVDTVRSAFGRSQSAEATSRAAPAPAMSP